jgi:hypothetical protein
MRYSVERVDSHALLTRLPLPLRGARLACVKPAASVRSEPGSNSHVENSIIGIYVTFFESTRTSHLFSKHQDPKSLEMSKTSVTSLDKRDRQSLFQRTSISTSPANSAAHVSLSSHIQLSKNRPENPVENLSKPKAQRPKPTISTKANSETSERKSSSPAAPPPSFSEGAYTAIPFSKSTLPGCPCRECHRRAARSAARNAANT